MRLSSISRIAIVTICAVGVLSVVKSNTLLANQQIAKLNLSPLPKQKPGVPFPTEKWQTEALKPTDKAKLDTAINKAFDNSSPELGETRAIIVVKGGKIIAEKYGQGFNEDSKLNSWSMAKSITASLFAITMKDNKISLDAAIEDPHWRKDDKRNLIKYREALQMSDGINWRENDYSDPIHNDAAIMLFGKGREDIVKYTANRPLKHKSGEVWNYSSGTTNLISAGISRALGPRTIDDPTGKERYRNFIFDRLFHEIGMNDSAPEFDAAGNFYASSLVQATAQDYARFGLLHLRDGIWENKRILPEGWVDFVRTPAVTKGAEAYGAHWWLSLENKKGLLKNGPYDSFEAQGHEGQVIMIVPSKDLVIVRLGLSTHENAWDAIGEYLSAIVESVPIN